MGNAHPTCSSGHSALMNALQSSVRNEILVENKHKNGLSSVGTTYSLKNHWVLNISCLRRFMVVCPCCFYQYNQAKRLDCRGNSMLSYIFYKWGNTPKRRYQTPVFSKKNTARFADNNNNNLKFKTRNCVRKESNDAKNRIIQIVLSAPLAHGDHA